MDVVETNVSVLFVCMSGMGGGMGGGCLDVVVYIVSRYGGGGGGGEGRYIYTYKPKLFLYVKLHKLIYQIIVQIQI